MIKIVEKIIPIEHQQILKNKTILENVWHLRDSRDFEKNLLEFYEPDIWFTGKERVFETYIAGTPSIAASDAVLAPSPMYIDA